MAKPKTKKPANKKDLRTLEGENVKIEIRPYEDGNLLGFATLYIYDEIKIYNCRILSGKTGTFLSFPSYKGSNDEYYSYCYIDKDSELMKEIVSLVSDYPKLDFE